jgi:hypothetical protein
VCSFFVFTKTGDLHQKTYHVLYHFFECLFDGWEETERDRDGQSRRRESMDSHYLGFWLMTGRKENRAAHTVGDMFFLQRCGISAGRHVSVMIDSLNWILVRVRS